jgi:hypothetical protein
MSYKEHFCKGDKDLSKICDECRYKKEYFKKELKRRILICKEQFPNNITYGTWIGLQDTILNIDKIKLSRINEKLLRGGA